MQNIDSSRRSTVIERLAIRTARVQGTSVRRLCAEYDLSTSSIRTIIANFGKCPSGVIDAAARRQLDAALLGDLGITDDDPRFPALFTAKLAEMAGNRQTAAAA